LGSTPRELQIGRANYYTNAALNRILIGAEMGPGCLNVNSASKESNLPDENASEAGRLRISVAASCLGDGALVGVIRYGSWL
jgi:hypothetical protein